MIRIILVNVIAFSLPFILYGSYIWLQRMRGRQQGKDVFGGRVVFLLVAIGLVLVIAGFLSLASFEGGSPDGVYVPPRYEDGLIIPGRIE
ncbi:MAG: DUF6111 family protein [Parvularculales bacterium]